MNYQKLYTVMPRPIQTLMLNAYAFKIHMERFGKPFERLLQHFIENERLSESQLIDYQNERLKALIEHAYRSVPYYAKLMNELKLRPDDIKTGQDLVKLPLLTREQIRDNLPRLVSHDFKKRDLLMGHTSGTTGSPLEFYWDRNMCLVNNVVDWRQKMWAGLNYGDKYGVLLGRMIVPPGQQTPPFWRMNYIHNQLWLSSFHLSEKNLGWYLDELNRFNPKVIEGYPSTVYILAKYLESAGATVPLKAVLTSSETLYPFQREVIEKVFRCGIFDFYGLAERVVFATECERHEGHHVNLDYGIMEIVDDKGERVKKGEMGWVVGTSLHNWGMPFLRYKTNDVTTVNVEGCTCGRTFPIMKDVMTKAEDIIVTKDGKYISPSVLTHPFKPLHTINMSQIIQEDVENITVRIVKSHLYTNDEEKRLIAELHARLGKDMKIRVEYVERIERSPSGKFKWVISKVPMAFK
jgi:phenylacetate-CoA ligase